jgi:hypothetical protein
MTHARRSLITHEPDRLMSSPSPRNPSRLTCFALFAVVVTLAGTPTRARAQADIRNTDVGRPIRIEDAYAIDRSLLDVHVAPITVAWARGSGAAWRLEPEVTFGLVPRTQIEVGAPVAFRDETFGLAGVNVGALYNLNAETTSWPALGVRGAVLLPVGQFGPARSYPSLKAIMTRTFDWARMNVNASYTFGTAPTEDVTADAPEVRRWLVGGAVDRSFVQQTVLLAAETFLEQPLDDAADPVWTVGAGLRYHLTPSWSIDAGIGTAVNGDARPVFLTFGIARSMAIRMLMPGMGRWGS